MNENKFDLKSRFKSYSNTKKAKKWLDKNINRVKKIFSDIKLRDYVFEPFKNVFHTEYKDSESIIKSTITTVALVNMVLSGLPGRMGVGVYVSMSLEAYMAYMIAKQVGLKVNSVNDIWKYFGLFAGISFVIIEGFRQLLSFAFSLASFIPMLPPIILAELIVTDFVGILFWQGFEAAKETGNFKIPKIPLKTFSKTKELFIFQKDMIIDSLSIENLKIIGKRLKAWLTGDIEEVEYIARGELFPTIAIMMLQKSEYESFNGPMGRTFIDALKRAYPKLDGSDIEEIGAYFANQGDIGKHIDYIKGEFFEHLNHIYENNDGDEWTSSLNPNRSEEGYDSIYTNHNTGEQIKVEYKMVDDDSSIYQALKNPEVIVITTDEREESFEDNHRVFATSESPFGRTGPYSEFDKIETVTSENVHRLIDNLDTLSALKSAGGSAIAKGIVSLWPFVIAYMRKRITQEQMSTAFEKVLGDTGGTLASRITWAIILGPIFGWYLLARGVIIIVRSAEKLSNTDEYEIRNIRID